MGEQVGSEDAQEPEHDPRESVFVLPPLERLPLADAEEKARAIRRVIEQAERERSAP